MAVPVYREDSIVGYGEHYLTVLSSFWTSTFEGKGYSYMAQLWRCFCHFNNENADKTLKNLNTDLKTLIEGPLPPTKQVNMLEGRSVQCNPMWNGTRHYAAPYLPVGINDWYLLSVVPNGGREPGSKTGHAGGFLLRSLSIHSAQSPVLGIRDGKMKELHPKHIRSLKPTAL